KEYTVINIEVLEQFDDGAVITADFLYEAGVIRKIEKDGLKVLGRGTLTKKLTVKAAKVSESARNAIVAAGGTVEVE
ncbi:MAG: uL15 family ribosomal protein, partial [Clostridia bacterium]|nr:uL15 family ribosomal protein [Clostridia bacterium]